MIKGASLFEASLQVCVQDSQNGYDTSSSAQLCAGVSLFRNTPACGARRDSVTLLPRVVRYDCAARVKCVFIRSDSAEWQRKRCLDRGLIGWVTGTRQLQWKGEQGEEGEDAECGTIILWFFMDLFAGVRRWRTHER